MAELSEALGADQVRANVWRYDPGAQGRRHRHADQEETFVVLQGTLTMNLGEPPERVVVPAGGVVKVAGGTPLQTVNAGTEDLLVYVYGFPPDEGAELPRCASVGKAMAITARPVSSDDLELICRHREEMFRDAGRDQGVLHTMTEHFRVWLEPRLANGSYFGFILSDGELPVAGIGMILVDWPPHPSHPEQDRRGYILNVYVEPTHRRRGLARQMVLMAETEFAERGIAFTVLHATDKGRPLYQELGWSPTAEMAKTTPRA